MNKHTEYDPAMAPAMAVLTAAYGPGGPSEAASIARQYVLDGEVGDARDLLYCLLDLSSTLLRRLDDGTATSHDAALRELGLQIVADRSAA
ncbi:hypothetical protein JGU71_12075 [Antrihabitans sp. YC3-6]|uniref:Uncharacterized protein n=1 Tax=Antrihabitans stalagmiti TaxID=2799499 RepID=A0A934NQV1_9NOCA|nr:hypothetical protein [Antrihabitans stalagmiti]MBJ8339625.1 hypothetical protein [Antrihabitans stalagmiti]